MKSKKIKGIVLHDFMQVNGGSEKLVLSLTKNLTNFSLITSGVYKDFTEMKELKLVSHRTASNIDFMPRFLKAILYFSCFVPKTDSDVSIYSGIYAPLATLHRKYPKNIYYCHTPPRFVFDRKVEYLRKVPILLKPLYLAFLRVYRFLYVSSLRRMDVILTNSFHMQRFIKSSVGFDSVVVLSLIHI